MNRSGILLFVVSVLLFVSCVGGGKSTIKSRHSMKSRREVLFVNVDSMVYFINPIKLKSESSAYLNIDYTYLFSKKSPENSVKVSFTLTSKHQYETLTSLKILYTNGVFETKTLTMMFQEMKDKNKFLIRYHFWIDKRKLQEICKSNSMVIKINDKEEFIARQKKWNSQAATIAQSLQNL